MKMYTNGQRKAMMYGGMSKRKPMMYGGMAAKKKKPRKKAQAGGMMTATQGQQNQMQNQTMQKPKMPMMGMKGGGKAFPDLTGDGKVDRKDILKGRGVPGFQEGGETKTDRQMMAEDTPKRRRRMPQLPKGMPDKDVRRRLRKIFDTISDQDMKVFMDMIRRNYR